MSYRNRYLTTPGLSSGSRSYGSTGYRSGALGVNSYRSRYETSTPSASTTSRVAPASTTSRVAPTSTSSRVVPTSTSSRVAPTSTERVTPSGRYSGSQSRDSAERQSPRPALGRRTASTVSCSGARDTGYSRLAAGPDRQSHDSSGAGGSLRRESWTDKKNVVGGLRSRSTATEHSDSSSATKEDVRDRWSRLNNPAARSTSVRSAYLRAIGHQSDEQVLKDSSDRSSAKSPPVRLQKSDTNQPATVSEPQDSSSIRRLNPIRQAIPKPLANSATSARQQRTGSAIEEPKPTITSQNGLSSSLDSSKHATATSNRAAANIIPNGDATSTDACRRVECSEPLSTATRTKLSDRKATKQTIYPHGNAKPLNLDEKTTLSESMQKSYLVLTQESRSGNERSNNGTSPRGVASLSSSSSFESSSSSHESENEEHSKHVSSENTTNKQQCQMGSSQKHGLCIGKPTQASPPSTDDKKNPSRPTSLNFRAKRTGGLTAPSGSAFVRRPSNDRIITSPAFRVSPLRYSSDRSTPPGSRRCSSSPRPDDKSPLSNLETIMITAPRPYQSPTSRRTPLSTVSDRICSTSSAGLTASRNVTGSAPQTETSRPHLPPLPTSRESRKPSGGIDPSRSRKQHLSRVPGDSGSSRRTPSAASRESASSGTCGRRYVVRRNSSGSGGQLCSNAPQTSRSSSREGLPTSRNSSRSSVCCAASRLGSAISSDSSCSTSGNTPLSNDNSREPGVSHYQKKNGRRIGKNGIPQNSISPKSLSRSNSRSLMPSNDSRRATSKSNSRISAPIGTASISSSDEGSFHSSKMGKRDHCSRVNVKPQPKNGHSPLNEQSYYETPSEIAIICPSTRTSTEECQSSPLPLNSSREILSSGISSQGDDATAFPIHEGRDQSSDFKRPIQQYDFEQNSWWLDNSCDVGSTGPSDHRVSQEVANSLHLIETNSTDVSDKQSVNGKNGLQLDSSVHIPQCSESSSSEWWLIDDNKFNDQALEYEEKASTSDTEVDTRFLAFPVRRNLSKPQSWWEDNAGETSEEQVVVSHNPIRFRSAKEMLGIYSSSDEEALPSDPTQPPIVGGTLKAASLLSASSISSSSESSSSSSSSDSDSVHLDSGPEESSSDEELDERGATSADELVQFSMSMLDGAEDDQVGHSAMSRSSSCDFNPQVESVLAGDEFEFHAAASPRDSGYATGERPDGFIGHWQDIDSLLQGEQEGDAMLQGEQESDAMLQDDQESGGCTPDEWNTSKWTSEAAAADTEAPSSCSIDASGDSSQCTADEDRQAAKRNVSMFICQMTNIDEMLGSARTPESPVTHVPAIVHEPLVPKEYSENSDSTAEAATDDGGATSDHTEVATAEDQTSEAPHTDRHPSSEHSVCEISSTTSTTSHTSASTTASTTGTTNTISGTTTASTTGTTNTISGTTTAIITGTTNTISGTTTASITGNIGATGNITTTGTISTDCNISTAGNTSTISTTSTGVSRRCQQLLESLKTSDQQKLAKVLFSMKTVFQEEKDLIPEFINSDGLTCLISAASGAEHKCQNYVLRALGQLMLYVDGMAGVMCSLETVSWLYALLDAETRLVVKTALRLLLVFLEYRQENAPRLVEAVTNVDTQRGLTPWFNLVVLLGEGDPGDVELALYSISLINRCLYSIAHLDVFYDQVDWIDRLGMEATTVRYLGRPDADRGLSEQLQLYEAVLRHEDGESTEGLALPANANFRRSRRGDTLWSEASTRYSQRHRRLLDDPTAPCPGLATAGGHEAACSYQPSCDPWSVRERRKVFTSAEESAMSAGTTAAAVAAGVDTAGLGVLQADSSTFNDLGMTPALRRRRQHMERLKLELPDKKHPPTSTSVETSPAAEFRISAAADKDAVGRLAAEDEPSRAQASVRDLRERLVRQSESGGVPLLSPDSETAAERLGQLSGVVSKAKEGLTRSVATKAEEEAVQKPPPPPLAPPPKSEVDLHWEQLMTNLNRPLQLSDLDFTDLTEMDESRDGSGLQSGGRGVLPPPPPPLPPDAPPLPPSLAAPSLGQHSFTMTNGPPAPPSLPPAADAKLKKTVKLFWKEVRPDLLPSDQSTVWDQLPDVALDTDKLEFLFESRAKDLTIKRQQENKAVKEIIVLGHKRSNAINICMTKLPPPRAIKAAILKMDSTIINKDGIEKLLILLPSEEEMASITDAQLSNPDLPLGSAENLLLTLGSISELTARLKLWMFKLDFDTVEKEVAEPLMDLKQGLENLAANETFKRILGMLRSIGNFLNNSQAKGFNFDYLSKVPEVKDTVQKHSLLHHLCGMVTEQFPASSDLYSELGAITRASRVDFDELGATIRRMEAECKASWDHLKVIAKHDGPTQTKLKMSEFLADSAERIIVLGIVHRRVLNRFYRFLSWLGVTAGQWHDIQPTRFCRVVSEFALEYRTTRERVLQQLAKAASLRNRGPPPAAARRLSTSSVPDGVDGGDYCSVLEARGRGASIVEGRGVSSAEWPGRGVVDRRSLEERADADLRQLLAGDGSDADTITRTRTWRRKISPRVGGCMTSSEVDGDLLKTLVNSAVQQPGTRAPRRHRRGDASATQRKSLKRSRTRENNVISEE